ncbi:hypothetical protein LAZ67_5001416 [Cordylochernes scorpioides]|uniref:Uncharacterized protein n=1 Tax=Cordylochernes scorpioides TaxID=51811 RepID=A0ABY6KFN4_9ARAC|nr:hypothetical protein LAZ67_5001416 [Cordylochernes scorpioides]
MKVMEDRYQGVWDCHMIADYCWNLSRDLPEYTYKRKSKRSHSEPSYCLPGFGGGPGVVNPTPPIVQFLAQRGFWERGDELQYASLEHPTHALLDSGPEIWLANPSFEYSHSGDIH